MKQQDLSTTLIGLLGSRLFLNLLFWTVYAGLPLWLNWSSFHSTADRNTDILWYVQSAVLAYFNSLVLMPLLFDRKRYGLYFSLLLLLVVSGEYIGMFFITPMLSPYLDYVDNKLLTYFYSLGDSFFIVLSLAAGRLARLHILQKRRMELLEQKQTQTELAFLRSQVNPHLLFNTLNMIYAHALENSPKVPDMILSLSQNMRYLLYECNEPLVSLQQEVQFLRDYVELQKMRIEDRGTVNFDVIGNLNGLQIAPMLLISFVENAFKHASQSRIDGIFIDICLHGQASDLLVKIKNSHEQMGIVNPLGKQGGIGMDNVKKRLALTYPNQHTLRIQETADQFYVQLSLHLDPAN